MFIFVVYISSSECFGSKENLVIIFVFWMTIICDGLKGGRLGPRKIFNFFPPLMGSPALEGNIYGILFLELQKLLAAN